MFENFTRSASERWPLHDEPRACRVIKPHCHPPYVERLIIAKHGNPTGPEVALVHMHGPERRRGVKPKGASQALHLLRTPVQRLKPLSCPSAGQVLWPALPKSTHCMETAAVYWKDLRRTARNAPRSGTALLLHI
jgi:hypothetical protein